ncbi:phosphoribosylformylglycinamidine synthase subunit PurQ [Bartonella sp. TP]|uniref:phosphoribosylformylglycinamidine synthase subunit PurQ n=1 Tax=Bartonella sp. TP TaxID=3057550 RepID=UPI0025B14491|nr:phosphoribosylformylglycinamidine synthase subunit PurQ [Bartonella sp. TP]WJW79918.1 phosphoribosylformylglycinamidine synthase subunit PurQ [Bartonella sp. TP]
MKIAIILFPGFNRYTEIKKCLEQYSSPRIDYIWHQETQDLNYDLIIIPGGFSYGDEEGAGTIAARSPIINSIAHSAKRGVMLLGICNGFQILTKAKLLPGQLQENVTKRFICKKLEIEITNNNTRFTQHYRAHQKISLPIAHANGRYSATDNEIKSLVENNQIIMRYSATNNVNGSTAAIAGIINKAGNICGIMPHPENYFLPHQGGTDGLAFFTSIIG